MGLGVGTCVLCLHTALAARSHANLPPRPTPTPNPPRLPSTQTVERHLQRLGAVHVEGCGDYEDHHMFSLEELQAAIRCGAPCCAALRCAAAPGAARPWRQLRERLHGVL